MTYKKILGLLFVALCSCSNSPELETSEMKVFTNVQKAIKAANSRSLKIDAKKIVTRQMIDQAKVPVLFVELSSGQNGTLTKYPGESFGETWIGVDGATIAFSRGILISSRGMGDDLMGASTSMPDFKKIKNKEYYKKTYSYIKEDNRIDMRVFDCSISKNHKPVIINIFDVAFETFVFTEQCKSKNFSFKNSFYVDDKSIVRRSNQYHGDGIGHIYTERLER